MTAGRGTQGRNVAGRAPEHAPETPSRRPLPALISLLVLTLLTALVWWRVLHRDDSHATISSQCPTTTGQSLPRPTSLTLTVLNSTTRAGLAKNAATALTKDGFVVSGYANDTGHAPIAGVGEIRYGSDQKGGADLVAFYIPGVTELALGANSTGKLVLSLGSGFHTVRTATQVGQAMASAHVSLAPKAVTTATTASC